MIIPKSKCVAVVLAGGLGIRLNTKTPKQLLLLGGKPLIAWCLQVFNSHASINEIIIVSHDDHIQTIHSLVESLQIQKVSCIVRGGRTRQESSWNALTNAKFSDQDIVLFHDAARPFVTQDQVSRCIEAVLEFGAAGTYVPVTDTITEGRDGLVVSIPERKNLFHTQTPQAFRYKIIRAAHERAISLEKSCFTDDVSLVLESGHPVKIVEGSYDNIKVTNSADWELAEERIKRRS